MTDIPDWAIERAIKEVGEDWTPSTLRAHRLTGYGHAVLHFARYIAEHEEPPVDPLLIEAREIADEVAGSDYHATGKYDDHHAVRCALTALKRGMEIERERNQ